MAILGGRSDSWEGLIEDEIAKLGQTTRRIIYLCADEHPSIGGILGISINVDCADLGRNRADYMQKSIQSPEQPDVLARVFHDIANCAESRLPRYARTAMSWTASATNAASWWHRT